MPADIRLTVPLAPPVTSALAVEALVAEASDGTCLLDGVSFAVEPGTLVAIAGPTGAGKTSLAAAIAGAIPITSGTVAVHGTDVTRLGSARRGIGYVSQEESLHGELTVRETLEFAAELRMRSDDAAARRAQVDSVLNELRLQPQVGTRVASLSGGQRKRVAIAVELLSRPAVLILDEPTSSLDPGYEASVVSTLRRLAEQGRCVVVVTHSEQVITECDRVAALASGGGLAYFGSPDHLHEYFGTSSAAALFSLLDEAPASLYIPKPAAPVRPGRSADRVSSVRAPARRQLTALARRHARVCFADRRRTALFALQALVLGVLLLLFVAPGGLHRPLHELRRTTPLSATGMAVLLVTSVTWLGMSNAIREIVKERRILASEGRAGLAASSYVVAKLAVLGPLVAVQAAVVAAIAVQRQLVPASGAVMPSGVAELVVTMSLAGLCAVTLGLFISAVVRSADKALAILPMVVVVEFVLSGLSPAISVAGLAQLRDLAASRWAVQAIGATVTGDRTAWWHAVNALALLSALAAVGTWVAVRRTLRVRTVRRPWTFGAAARVGLVRRNPEMVRLSRVGGASLAAIALVLVGVQLVFPAGSSTPALAATTSPAAAEHHAADADLDPSVVAAHLPGVVGNLWWLWRTGTQLSLDVTAAAYAASTTS